MKTRFHKFTWPLAIAAAAAFSIKAGPPEKTSTPVAQQPVPKSAFSIPTKPQDGHDPFFPNSDRLFASKTAPKSAPQSTGAVLVFNGISGTQERRLAMINSRTMAEGEEADVNTPNGRTKVRLVEIKGEVAIVEVAGERRELRFQNH